MRARWGSNLGRFLAYSALACALLAGCEKRDAKLTAEVRRLDARLDQIHRATELGAGRASAPPAEMLRAVFTPIQESVEQLANHAATDRQRVSQLTGEVRSLVAMVETQGGAESSQGLTAMRARLDALDTRLQKQRASQAEDKALLVRALQSSTKRLDRLLESLVAPPAMESIAAPGSTGRVASGASDGSGARAGSVGSTPTGEGLGSFLDRIDFDVAVVIFLAVSLFLTVLVLVFLPGRRRNLPRIEYVAEREDQESPEHAQEVLEELSPVPSPTSPSPSPSPSSSTSPSSSPGAVRASLENGSAGTRENGNHRGIAADDGERPVPHELSLALRDESSLQGLVEILDAYLNTEPYILRNPPPRVALDEGELHLQFYALPNLSPAEHALLDATVRRLQPSEPAAREASMVKSTAKSGA